jgi:hypothetical protein
MLRLHRAIGNQASRSSDIWLRHRHHLRGLVLVALASAAAPVVQRKCECGGTCADCQSNHRGEPAQLQTKPVGPNGSDLAEAPPMVHEAGDADTG